MIKSNRRKHLEAKQAIGRARGLASQRVQKACRKTQEIDADTLLRRALHDARGQIVREGCDYQSSDTTHWKVSRAIKGRTDQFEFVANGRVKLLGGPRRFPVQFRPENNYRKND